jgi:uncharacterized membrane protein YfcA
MTLAQHALFLLCVALACYVQNLTGFAFGLVLLGLAGLLSLASMTDVANVVSVLALLNALMLFRTSPPVFERRVMLPTLGTSLLGVVAGVLLLNWLSDNVVAALSLLLGVTIAGCALILVQDAAVRAQRSPGWTFAATGLLSGLLGGLFSTAGPPLVYHFYRQPMALPVIRDALVGVFAVNGVLRLAMMVAGGRFSVSALWLCVEAAPLVLLMTRWMARRPPPLQPRTVRRVVCVLLLLVSAGLVVPAVRMLFAPG